MKDYKIGRVVDYLGKIGVDYRDENNVLRFARPSQSVNIYKNDMVIGFIRSIDDSFEVVCKTQIKDVNPDRVARVACNFVNEEPDILLNLVYEPVYPEDLNKKIRHRNIVVARQLSHFLYRFISCKSTSIIGKIFGGLDHATVLHSTRSMVTELSTNERFLSRIQDLVDDIVFPSKKMNLTVIQHNFQTCQI